MAGNGGFVPKNRQ